MPYVKVVGGVVVQKQCSPGEGFSEVDNSVICGMLLIDGAYCLPPPLVTQASKRTEVDCHCASVLSSGFSYGGTTFQASVESQRRIAARATRALANKIDAVTFPWVAPHSDGWWDVNNIVLTSTQTVDGFLAFAKAFGDYCSACEKCKRDHKSAITPENCATYNYTTGWPVNP